MRFPLTLTIPLMEWRSVAINGDANSLLKRDSSISQITSTSDQRPEYFEKSVYLKKSENGPSEPVLETKI